MKKIYKDAANEDVVVFDNVEDAHDSSIQTVAWEIHGLITNDDNYVKNMEDLLPLSDQIAKCCDKLKAACKGKYVKTYILEK